MTAIHLLDHHAGGHCVPRPSFFRRLVRSFRREVTAPESPSARSGAAAGRTYPRPTYYGRHDGAIVVDERERVHVRPVNGRSLGTQPRRNPAETRADLVALARPYAPDVAA